MSLLFTYILHGNSTCDYSDLYVFVICTLFSPRRWCSAFIPRRAVLYVPGNDERKLQKATKLGADCIVMDCEDGVAVNRKVSTGAVNTTVKVTVKVSAQVTVKVIVQVSAQVTVKVTVQISAQVIV